VCVPVIKVYLLMSKDVVFHVFYSIELHEE
jgi:hypothetical protein